MDTTSCLLQGLGMASAVADPSKVTQKSVKDKKKEQEKAEILQKTRQRFDAL